VKEIARAAREASPPPAHILADLAKSDVDCQNRRPNQHGVAGGGKPARAAAEVSRQMTPAAAHGRTRELLHRTEGQGADRGMAAGPQLAHYDPGRLFTYDVDDYHS